MVDEVAKQKKQNKQRHDLHVQLILNEGGVEKAEALVVAWLEGPGGLNQRMPQKQLPLEKKP